MDNPVPATSFPSRDWSGRSTPFYSILADGKTRSYYNGYLVFLALVSVAVVRIGLSPLTISMLAFFVANLAVGYLVDGGDEKVRLLELPIQMLAYLQLLLRWAIEVLPIYVLSFLFYLLIRPVWQSLNLWGGASFLPVYGFYLLLRTVQLVRYLVLVRTRWDDPPARNPIGQKEGNFRDRASASRHLIWSYCIGNVGVTVRCGTQVGQIFVFETAAAAMGPFVLDWHRRFPLLSGGSRITVLLAGTAGVLAVLLWQRKLYPFADYIYYRVHRTLHENRALFTFLHRIHHKAIVTTPLDSGTICPLEFVLTETVWPPAALVPDWLWTIWQVHFAVTGYWPSHRTTAGVRVQDGNTFHVYHHYKPNVNFGILPESDARFGTLYGITYRPWRPEQIRSLVWRWFLANRYYRNLASRASAPGDVSP